MIERFVLDTSVTVDSIILKSMYRPKTIRLFDKALNGELELYVSPITLSETLYIASRIYEAARIENPNTEALDFIEWVKRRARVVGISEDTAIRAGELKKTLHIALSDCYVISTAEAVEATSLFKSIEREMKPVLSDIRRLGVKFMEEIQV